MLRKFNITVVLAMLLLLSSCNNASQPAPTIDLGGNASLALGTEPEVLEQLQAIDPSATRLGSIMDFRPYQETFAFVQCNFEFYEEGMKLTGTADSNAAEAYLQNGWIENLEAIIMEKPKENSVLQIEIFYDPAQTTSSFMELIYTTKLNQTLVQGQTVRLHFSPDKDSCIFSIPATEYTRLMLWPVVGTETILIKHIDLYTIE